MPTPPGTTLKAAQRNTLVRAREQLDLSAAALGTLIGESQQTIDKWEKGVRNPPLAKLKKWAKALGFAVEVGETRLVKL